MLKVNWVYRREVQLNVVSDPIRGRSRSPKLKVDKYVRQEQTIPTLTRLSSTNVLRYHSTEISQGKLAFTFLYTYLF